MKSSVAVERLAPLVALASAIVGLARASAEEIVVMTPGAFAAPFGDAAPWFERRTGHSVVTVLGEAVAGAPDSIPARLGRGERADVVIAPAQALDALVAAGDVEAGTHMQLVRPRDGAPPDRAQRGTLAAGVAAATQSTAAARELVAFLASPAAGPILERHGLEPLGYAAGDWLPLFNGRDLTGWTPKIRGHALGDNHAGTFRVRDGALEVAYDGYATFAEQFGHLFFAEPFSRYRLRVEYRFVGAQAPGAPAWAARNSGVMVHSQPPETMLRDQDFPISIEVQFLGGLGGGNARPTGNVCTPGTRILLGGAPDTTHCIQSSAPTIDGDRWVTADVLVQADEHIVHYIDGLPVVEYGGVTFGGGNVNGHDAREKPDGRPLARGYIALQSESHPIQFRRVELLDLTGCTGSCR